MFRFENRSESVKSKHAFFNDHPKRRALLKFLGKALPERTKDGRIGLVIAQSFIEGYEKGFARASRAQRRSGEQS
jgi:hypothetical protein